MSKEERENWIKIKQSLEAYEATDSFYYRRACAIVEGKPDPMEALKFIEDKADE